MNTIDDQNNAAAREVEDLLERIAAPLRQALKAAHIPVPKLRPLVAHYAGALELQTQWEADAVEYLTPRYFELTDEVNTLLAALKQRAGIA